MRWAESTRAYIHSWIIRLLFRHPGASAVVPFLSDPRGDDPQPPVAVALEHLPLKDRPKLAARGAAWAAKIAAAAKAFRNVRTLLAGYADTAPVADSDKITAAQLREAVEMHLRLIGENG